MAQGVGTEAGEGEEAGAGEAGEIFEGVDACAGESIGGEGDEAEIAPVGGPAGDLAAEEDLEPGTGRFAEAAVAAELLEPGSGQGIQVGESGLAQGPGGTDGKALVSPVGDHRVDGLARRDLLAEEDLAGVQGLGADAVEGEEVFTGHGAQAIERQAELGEGDGGLGRDAALAPEDLGADGREVPFLRALGGPGKRPVEDAFERLDRLQADARNGEKVVPREPLEVGDSADTRSSQGEGARRLDACRDPEARLGVALLEGAEGATGPPSASARFAHGVGLAAQREATRRESAGS